MAVTGELDTAGEAFFQVVQERSRIIEATLPNMPGRDELCIGIQRDPRPGIAHTINAFEFFGDISLFTINPLPNLIYLYQLAGEVSHDFVMVFGAGCSGSHQDGGDSFSGMASQSDRGQEGTAFRETGNDSGAFLCV